MTHLVTLLIGIALGPRVGLADEPKVAIAVEKVAPRAKTDDKPADEAAADKKKEDAKAEPAPPAKAQKGRVTEVLQAIGQAIQERVAPALEAEADPMVQQFMPQFRQMLSTELHFVRTVCEPTPEQYKTIKAAGDTSLKLAIKKFAEVQKKMQQGGMRPGQQQEYPDPRKLIAEGLVQSVKHTLPADQANRYDVELEKRAAARKRVAVINLVAKLDKDLVLTAEQRSKLTDSLDSNWKGAWGQQLEVFMYGDQFLPVLPDEQVLPILNEKQKEIWKGTAKNQNTVWGGWFGFGFVQGVEIEEEPAADAKLPDETDKAAKKQEVQP